MRELSTQQDLKMGCDPEFFITKNGKVIGAEHVLPKEGLIGPRGKFIIDGVQIEMNPAPSYCRGLLGNYIGDCFRLLERHLELGGYKKEGVSVSFDNTVKITRTNFEKLSNNCKQFGCSVSNNVGPDGQIMRSYIDVDPTVYRSRSGGGHIHFGDYEYTNRPGQVKKALKNVQVMVPVLDIILGNTMVLIDRDRGNRERRKTYGRAGEFRLPSYGLEYRTPSNFWLKSPVLFSLAFGLARLAVQLVVESDRENNYVKELLSRVDMEDIHDAINRNSALKARRNFDKILDLLMDIIPAATVTTFYPFSAYNIEQFNKFVIGVQKEKIKFTKPFETWLRMDNAHNHGINDYLNRMK